MTKQPCLYPLPDGRRCCECDTCQGESAATTGPRESLIVVALKTDQANIQRRLTTILAAAEPTVVDSEAQVWAKPVDDLVAADLDALAAVVGWDAVSRLRVGDVVAVGFQHPSGDAASGDAAGSSATNDPGDADA